MYKKGKEAKDKRGKGLARAIFPVLDEQPNLTRIPFQKMKRKEIKFY